jgi:hypothetical protein
MGDAATADLQYNTAAAAPAAPVSMYASKLNCAVFVFLSLLLHLPYTALPTHNMLLLPPHL